MSPEREPETLTELFEVIDNPPYKGVLQPFEEEEMVLGWLRRHFDVRHIQADAQMLEEGEQWEQHRLWSDGR